MRLSITNTEKKKQIVLVILILGLVLIFFKQVPIYYNKVKQRVVDNVEMITKHRSELSESLIQGNIVYIGNSVSNWIFPPTDFNFYFFIKQNKINKLIDSVFNISLIAEHNVNQINKEKRSKFDTYIYWGNEHFARYLLKHYNLTSFDNLKSINASMAIDEYVSLKHAKYVLTDESNKKYFLKATIVKEFNAGFKKDSCFSYTLSNKIYLLKIK